MSELLGCPFCGGVPNELTLQDEPNYGGRVLECGTCGAASRVFFGECGQALREAWNRRASPPAQTGELTLEQLVPLWDAINEFADAPKLSVRRQRAVVTVERIVRALTHSPGPAEARDAARYQALRSGSLYRICGLYVADGGNDWKAVEGADLDQRVDDALSQSRQQGEL